MASVLFSRPSDDVTLNYLYYYSKELVSVSNSLGHKTINKEKEEANKKIILSVIEKQKPEFIMFNGHGSSEVICGHKQEVIVSAKENPGVLKNAIIYSLSCSSASVLGPVSIENGATSFIGYKFDFALGKDTESEASPKHDKIAKMFLEPSNILVDSLMKGKNVKRFIENGKKKMAENIDYLHTTSNFPEAVYYAPFLFSNYMGLVAHGNQEASIN